jgi:hypothetical protein
VGEAPKAVSADGADPAGVLAEAERLTGEPEAHPAYEEERSIPLLDAPVTAP